FKQPQVREKVPMYFVYGAQDTKTEKYVQRIYNQVLSPKTDKKVPKLTGLRGIDGTKLAGRELLVKSLKTEELLLSYTEKVIAEHGSNAWERHDARKTQLYPVPFEQFVR